MPSRVVCQSAPALIAEHTPVSGDTTLRPFTVTRSIMHLPSAFRRSCSRPFSSVMVAVFVAAS